MNVRFRPLPAWPHKTTHPQARRGPYTFKAGWPDTLALLERELAHLNAKNIVIGIGMREADLRQDGMPRANAKEPSHPGVEISFDTRHGRLVYATDVCVKWQHNVRSIALGLGDLRAVDLHIGSQAGAQYAGYRELGAGSDSGVVMRSTARGEKLIEHYGSVGAALKATHPDTRDPDRTDDDYAAVLAAKAAR